MCGREQDDADRHGRNQSMERFPVDQSIHT
jgi:hypothetical protein